MIEEETYWVSEQEYRLLRTYWVSVLVVTVVTLFCFFTAVDVVFWQSWFTAWVTPDNFIPVTYSVAGLSLPFWILGGLAENKLRREFTE